MMNTTWVLVAVLTVMLAIAAVGLCVAVLDLREQARPTIRAGGKRSLSG
jgi:mannose/fructose/N-acetylgalactosamine-specific phosphotransferase system component IIC